MESGKGSLHIINETILQWSMILVVHLIELDILDGDEMMAKTYLQIA